MPRVQPRLQGGDADGRLRLLLRVPRLSCPATSAARGLLRLLFLRLGALPASTSRSVQRTEFPSLTSRDPRVPIIAMRRTSLLLVAAAYGLSFLVVCFGNCLAAAPLADHGCCAGREGIRAAPVDCCSVTQSASPDAPRAGAFPPIAFVSPSMLLAVVSPPPFVLAPAALAASPPRILRT